MAARNQTQLKRPFQHFRLVLFFLGVAVLGVGTGLWRVQRLGASPRLADVEWIVGSTAVLTALVGFVGVFVHRLSILPVRWRETEKYLIAIRRESQNYRALMEGAADMLLVVDPDNGRVRECNARAREEIDLPAGYTKNFGVASIVLDADLQRFSDALHEAVSSPGLAASLTEIRLKAKEGRTLVADARLAGIALEDERVVQVALRDLTRQKEMEKRLQIHERLSSIGLLTAGVAHEINNPLEGIGNYLALLEREGGDVETRRRHLELVRHGFSRIREIVRDLLRFARPAAGSGDADLAAVVESAKKLAAYSDRFKGVTVVVEGLETPLLVDGDAGRLEQVVVNLLLNAATAMKSKGRILVRARRIASGERGTGEIELSVADEGRGIPPGDLARIFDPFFTTTQGTGLGLSVSYGIVRAHGGNLAVRNLEGGGAEFTIHLPAAASGAKTRSLQPIEEERKRA
jgi:signal transduction histidine kinase